MKISFLLPFMIVMSMPTYAVEHNLIEANDIQYNVVKIENLNKLKLFLKDKSTNRYYQKFSNLRDKLPACKYLNFAMNAGMYHADFQPVGLYVENGKVLTQLNEEKGFGNFFMQPNGVVAWNDRRAVIKTTVDYKHDQFKAQFATQSGPILVNQGQINKQFLPNSNSLKVRNGVGVKNNQLYFVISQQRVSFYQFADFFKQQLKIDNALYLDGSISSLYSAQIKRNDETFNLGPIVAEIDAENCKK